MLNKIKNTLLLGLMFSLMTVHADDHDENKTRDAREAYEFGQMALQSKDWRDAIEAFKTAARNKRLRAASNYWQAYSHYQVKQNAQAKRLLERLIRNHPDSEWSDDAKVLLFEHGDGEGQANHQDELDEELKLFALQQIMFNKPEKALPKVYAMLEQSDSERIKMNAIQILGLSDSEEVVDYLFRFVEKERNEDLQQQAIQMLSLRGGKNSRDKLRKLYDKSQSQEIKTAIIQGFIHHDGSEELIAVLKRETDPELTEYLIQMLGIKGETAALKDMYKKSQGEQRRAILEALALSGDASYLYYVIDNEVDQEIRNQAIHSLIMVNDDNMGDYLVRLYEKARSSDEKDVIASVFIATDIEPEAVVRIIKQERSTERKQALLNTLMAMGEVDALEELYVIESDGELKGSIVHLLGVMDATDVLVKLYKEDPSIAESGAFFEAFGVSSSALDESFLMDQFKRGNEEVKQGVLQAFMMHDNVDAMIKLLKTEKNHEVKKQIIQMIGITDSDALIDALEN